MRVLYVSKAMVVPAYRDKLRSLADRVELRAIVPDRWGSQSVHAGPDEPWLSTARTWANGHNHLHAYRDASRLIAGSAADLVHIDEEPYSVVTAQLARQCRRGRIPFVFFAWQNLPKRIPAPFRTLRRYVFQQAAGGIAGTTSAADVLRAWGFQGALTVIPQMGVDTGRFHPDPELRAASRRRIGALDDDFVVGFGGRLVREKGVHLLLEAVSPLPGAKLLFLGDGPERGSLESEAIRAGAADRTHFAGAVDAVEMPGWLVACDVVVLPSLTTARWAEQFGRILVEAMACGVVVVGSNSGEIPHVIDDAGLIVPESDAVSLRAALVRLMSSPADRAGCSVRARQRVARHYTNERIVERTVGFYRDVLAAAGTTP